MTPIHGFELLKEQEIPELNTMARLWRHLRTRAELLSLENDDENKVFGVTFRTPPPDSTGLPHIMEHAVLCGSQKYPVKEPFIELAKGSLKTFLNAFTFPDKTCYPVASQNVKDFYNLIDVYLDAVFYPLIPPHTLQQEGWHYELEDPADPLTFKGVVFNEMKGAYSSPDNLLYRYSQQSLFPDNPYGLDSGGDPGEIPNLTYEQFKRFHQTYYHPSNARIFFYGDDDPEERLRLIDAVLREFEPLAFSSAIPLQPRFDRSQRFTYPYDAGQETEGDGKAMLTTNWMLAESTDPETILALSMLSHILIGTPASPLRKALIDSGLGEDLTGGGLDSDLRQMVFSTGLKGIADKDADKVEALILDTLAELAEKGIDPDMVEAAVNTIEFRLRENNTGSFPRGLSLMLRSLVTWLYDGDPIAPLAFEAPLSSIKGHLEAGEPYFEDLTRRYLVENPHRTTVLLQPDPELRQRQEAAEAERLAQARAAMDEAQLQAVIEDTRQLKLLQETPDPPEALATIPTLTLEDLDKENKLIPLAVLQENGTEVLYHDLFTNGIVYLDLGFNLRALPQELLPYVPLFGHTLVKIGTEKEDFVKLSQRIGRKTGGIAPTTLTSAIPESQTGTTWLFLRGKATASQAQDLLAILQDVLLKVKLDNQERFKQLVLEAKARAEAYLVPGGHRVVDTRLRARFDQAGWAAEQMDGIDYLLFLRQVAQELEENWPAVLEKLEQVRRTLVNREDMLCNVTLDEANWTGFRPQLASFLSTLPTSPVQPVQWSPGQAVAFEGLTIPAQVNYVGKAANLYRLGYQLNGSIAVIRNHLNTTWLWERVRVQGGAYGGFCVFDHPSGVLSYLSYRDPNLLNTLDNYDGTARFLRQLDLSPEELTKSIIGAIGQMDAYQLPDAKGYTSMVRYLIGDTDAKRQRRREEILSTTPADFKAFADVLEEVNQEGQVVVLGSQEAIAGANAARGGWLEVKKVL
jgi:Zn-dependent M16 (insulinase) family peptidase